MAVDRDLLRAARNGFLLILLALVAISVYQFATRGRITPVVAVIWIVGAGGFYASKWYYGRQDDAAGAEGDDDTSGDGDEAGGDRDDDAGVDRGGDAD